jgi:hypothetical protein
MLTAAGKDMESEARRLAGFMMEKLLDRKVIL